MKNIKKLYPLSLALTAIMLLLVGIASAAPYAYISNSNDDTVSVIDTATNNFVQKIAVGNYPYGVAVNPAGTKAYVANEWDDNVSVIDTSTNTVTKSITVGDAPTGVAVNLAGTKVYVANSGGSTRSVSVIDTSTDIVTATVDITSGGTGVNGIAVTPDGTKVYVVHQNTNKVSVIDTASNSVSTTLTVGAQPIGIAVSPDGTKAYVVNSADNNISIISTSSDTATGSIDVGSIPYGIAFNPAGTRAYVTNFNDNTVLVIDASTDSVIGSPISVGPGSHPWGIAVNRAGTYVYVVNRDSDNVAVISTSSNEVITYVYLETENGDARSLGQFTVFFTPEPDYTIEKTVTDVAGKGASANGTNATDVITYSIKVNNTGNVNLTGVTVSDSLINPLPSPSGDNAPTGTLNVGETWIYTPTHSITQPELNTRGGGDGDIDNTVTVDCDQLDAKNDSKAVNLDYNPAYSINKTITDIIGGVAGNVTKAGDIVRYRINVTNEGNIDLTNVILNDTLINITGRVESKTSDGILNPGEIWTYNVNYTVTQADIDDNGTGDEFINNTVTIDCDQLEPKSASAAAHIDQTPYWVNKTVLDVGGRGPLANATKAGDKIIYQINVTNYGGLPFQPVSIYDSLATITGPTESKTSDKILNPGENWTYIGNYTVTQSDLNDNGGGDGVINNTVTVYFYGGVKRFEQNKLVSSESSSADVPVLQNPSLTVNKTVTDITGGVAGNVTKAGDIVNYQINVTNDGNIDLTNVTVNDSLISISPPNETGTSDGILSPDESWIYTGNYTVTQNDINSNGNGDEFINNTVSVSCDQLEQETTSAAAHIDQTPYLVNKSVTNVAGKGPSANVTRAGDNITYQINITNYGGLTFDKVAIYDSLGILNGPYESKTKNRYLDPGENWIFIGNYTVTQAELNDNGGGDGTIDNTFTADFYGGVKGQGNLVGSESANASVPVEQNPSYMINKTVLDVAENGSTANVTKAGDIITYQINVTNDGNIDLNNALVTDSLTNVTNHSESITEDGILNPEESWTYTVNYTATQADLNNNGSIEDVFITNTATVDCTELETQNDSATVPVEQHPAYSINKTVIDVDEQGPATNVTLAGQVITYQVNLTNEGNIDLNNVSVNDSIAALEAPTESKTQDGILEVGEYWTYAGDYTVLQTDLNSNGTLEDGFITNTVTVDCNQLEEQNDTATVPVEQHPAYSINKTVTDVAGNGSTANVTKAGDVITYQINLTNEGNIDLNNVSVNDSIAILGAPEESKTTDDILEVGENWTYEGNYTVLQWDLNSNGTLEDGFITNTVTVDCDQLEEQNDTETVPVEQYPAYSINKTVTDVAGNGSTANVTEAGDVITYQVNLTNEGNIDLTNVSVNDSIAALEAPIESKTPDDILEVGENWTYEGNYTVLQLDLNSNGTLEDGFITNTVTVDCDQLELQNDTEKVPVEQHPNYSINKTVKDVAGKGPEANVTSAGDVITYLINVTNDGNIDLTSKYLTDLTLNDSLVNLTGPVESKTDDDILEVGENWTYEGNYSVLQWDLNSNGTLEDGFITNTATINSSLLGLESDSAKVPVEQHPNYSINKTVKDVAGKGPEANVTSAGDIITYLVNVTNDGNIDLTSELLINLALNDSLVNLTEPVESKTDDDILEVGENWTYEGNYTVLQWDLNSNGTLEDGFITNTATINSSLLGLESDSAKVPVEQHPSYSIDKTVTDVAGNGPAANITKAGDVVTYQIKVTNDGNIDLSNITVNDSLINLIGPVESKTDDNILEVGENWTYEGNYTVTQEDVNTHIGMERTLNNTATVESDELESKSDSAEVPIDWNPAYSIEKTVTDVADRGSASEVNKAGDVIDYQVKVSNEGNVNLTNVTVNDSLINLTEPVESLNTDGILEIAENWTYTGNYTVTQADLNSNGTLEDGFITNAATIDCDELEPQNDTAQVPVDRNPSYSIFKSSIGVDEKGDCIINKANDIIQYRIVVKNEGNVDLKDVSVNDPMITLTGPAGNDVDPEVLNPGEVWVYTGNYTVTVADINNESANISNTATVSSSELPEKSSSLEMPIDKKADLSIYKAVIGIDETGDYIINNPGDVINYQIAAKNNGDVNLTGVSVSDPKITLTKTSGDHNNPGVLNPGELWVYTGNYTVTQADIANNGENGSGYIKNTATVSCDGLDNRTSSVELQIVRIINAGTDSDTPAKVYPVAVFSTSATSGYAPLTVQFTDSSTGAPTSWSWDFNGDGVVDSSVQSPSYTYETPGTYVAKLTVINANGTNSKTETINVQQTGSSNGGGSSGGSSSSGGGSTGGSAEPASNIEVKEISQAFIESGKSVKFDFPRKVTSVENISFDSKKTFGKTTAIVEMLKGKSSLVSGVPADEIYKYINIWVGNSGYVSSSIENAVVCFKVEKSWIQDKKIDKSSITLNRYSDNKWGQLQTSQIGEDDKYLYFTAKTPGFSPFAITGKQTATGSELQPGSSNQVGQSNGNTAANTGQKNNTSTPVKQSKRTPGFEMIFGVTALLGAVYLYRRR